MSFSEGKFACIIFRWDKTVGIQNERDQEEHSLKEISEQGTEEPNKESDQDNQSINN